MQIEDPISTTGNCRYCLMCTHVCPVGGVTRRETLTPHGWGLTIQSVQRGLLEWNEDSVDALFSCADCGLCRANCVTDQPLPTAIATARAEVLSLGQAPASVTTLGEALAEWGNPFEQQAPENGSTNAADLALFVGDEARYLWPEALEAARALLSTTGEQLVEIGIGRSNGYLASSLGFTDIARSLVQATLDELQATGAKKMLVLTAGDYFVFHQLADERLGIAWPEEVELLELTEHLVGQVEAGTLTLKQADEKSFEGSAASYAYVDPTHAARIASRHDVPRSLLKHVLPGESRELFWRRERARPVGSTALQFTNPGLARALTRARLEDAQQAGAALLLCEDPGTLAQLRDQSEDFDFQVQGLYELLANHIDS